MLGAFVQAGWMLCEDPADADLILINTCGFIESAREEALAEIASAVDMKKQGACRAVAVIGCLTQYWGDSFAQRCPGVDVVGGLIEPEKVEKMCRRALDHSAGPTASLERRTKSDTGARLRITPAHYAYLQIAEGCNNCCSYCAIPAIRGPLASRPMEEILDEARQLHGDGVEELCVIAQDTSAYGTDIQGHPRLPELLRKLSTLDLFHWIRLYYVHPAGCSDELIQTIADVPAICRYVDMPVQHVNDEILRRMNRRTNGGHIRRVIDRMRERIDGLVLRTSLIAGLPGETPERFDELKTFVERTRFERLGAFAYSPEEGTPAAAFEGRVDAQEAQRRCQELMLVQQQIALEHARSRVGQTIECVVDEPSEGGRWTGRTYGDAPEIDTIIELTGRGLSEGVFGMARVTAAHDYDLAGTMNIEDLDESAQ